MQQACAEKKYYYGLLRSPTILVVEDDSRSPSSIYAGSRGLDRRLHHHWIRYERARSKTPTKSVVATTAAMTLKVTHKAFMLLRYAIQRMAQCALPFARRTPYGPPKITNPWPLARVWRWLLRRTYDPTLGRHQPGTRRTGGVSPLQVFGPGRQNLSFHFVLPAEHTSTPTRTR